MHFKVLKFINFTTWVQTDGTNRSLEFEIKSCVTLEDIIVITGFFIVHANRKNCAELHIITSIIIFA